MSATDSGRLWSILAASPGSRSYQLRFQAVAVERFQHLLQLQADCAVADLVAGKLSSSPETTQRRDMDLHSVRDLPERGKVASGGCGCGGVVHGAIVATRSTQQKSAVQDGGPKNNRP